MNSELFAFLLECGIENEDAWRTERALTEVVKQTHQYNRLVGILNEIRLTENPENEQSGNST